MMLPDQCGHGSHSQRMKKPQRHGPAVGACELPNAGYRGIEATLSRLGGLQKLSGPAFTAGYERAAWIGAGLCVVAAAIALVTIPTGRQS